MTKTYQFKITLCDNLIPIWRQFIVSGELRMDRFHQVIQIVMGWKNSHIHDFNIGERTIGIVEVHDDLYPPNLEDETTLFLKDLELIETQSFHYLYDPGDHWLHELIVEQIADGKELGPICLEGRNACPPEDCGGIHGYTQILEILKAPFHPEFKEWMQWLPPGFDPYSFSLLSINKELKKLGSSSGQYPDRFSLS